MYMLLITLHTIKQKYTDFITICRHFTDGGKRKPDRIPLFFNGQQPVAATYRLTKQKVSLMNFRRYSGFIVALTILS